MMAIRYEIKPDAKQMQRAAGASNNQNIDLEEAITLQKMVDKLLEGAFGGQPMNKADLMQHGFSAFEIEAFGDEAVNICRRQAIKQVHHA